MKKRGKVNIWGWELRVSFIFKYLWFYGNL